MTSGGISNHISLITGLPDPSESGDASGKGR